MFVSGHVLSEFISRREFVSGQLGSGHVRVVFMSGREFVSRCDQTGVCRWTRPDWSLSKDTSEQCLCLDGLALDASGGCLSPGVFIV